MSKCSCIFTPSFPAPNDYTGASTNVTFFPGDKNVTCVNITVVMDQRVENTEDFYLKLSSDSPEEQTTRKTVKLLDSSGMCFK